MAAEADNMALGVDAVHAERGEGQVFDHLEKSGLFVRRHYFRFKQEASGRTFEWKQALLVDRLSEHSFS